MMKLFICRGKSERNRTTSVRFNIARQVHDEMKGLRVLPEQGRSLLWRQVMPNEVNSQPRARRRRVRCAGSLIC